MNIVSILGSNRVERNGGKVFSWLQKQLENRGDFNFSFIDIAQNDLPFVGSQKELNEKQKETKESLRKELQKADGFIFVVPEYNHSFPGAFKNILDHFYEEWKRKPVAFVTYSSGMSGGIRATEQLRQVAGELHMADIRDAVHIPFIDEAFDDSGVFIEQERKNKKLEVVLENLMWWTKKLKS